MFLRRCPFRPPKCKEKSTIDNLTLTMTVEFPDSFSADLKDILSKLLVHTSCFY